MSLLRRRLEKLEEARGSGVARMIVMSAQRNMSEEESTAFLATQGVSVSKADLVVRLVTIYEDREGSDAPEQAPPKLLSVHPQKRTA